MKKKLGKKVKKFLIKFLSEEYSKEESIGQVNDPDTVITLSIKYENGMKDEFVLGFDNKFHFQDHESDDTRIKE